jgi:hypothetical protein
LASSEFFWSSMVSPKTKRPQSRSPEVGSGQEK